MNPPNLPNRSNLPDPDAPRTPREELEIKITALLMRQLPEEEAVALRAQIAADPELAALHAQLAHAVQLLREARALPEQPGAAPAAPLQFSQERREKLLAAFRGIKALPSPPASFAPAAAAAAPTLPATSMASTVSTKSRWWNKPTVLAASIAVLIGGGVVFLGSGTVLYKSASNAPENFYAEYSVPTPAGEAAPHDDFALKELPAEMAPSSPPDSLRLGYARNDTKWSSQPGATRAYQTEEKAPASKFSVAAAAPAPSASPAPPPAGEGRKTMGALAGAKEGEVSRRSRDSGVYLPSPAADTDADAPSSSAGAAARSLASVASNSRHRVEMEKGKEDALARNKSGEPGRPSLFGEDFDSRNAQAQGQGAPAVPGKPQDSFAAADGWRNNDKDPARTVPPPAVRAPVTASSPSQPERPALAKPSRALAQHSPRSSDALDDLAVVGDESKRRSALSSRVDGEGRKELKDQIHALSEPLSTAGKVNLNAPLQRFGEAVAAEKKEAGMKQAAAASDAAASLSQVDLERARSMPKLDSNGVGATALANESQSVPGRSPTTALGSVAGPAEPAGAIPQVDSTKAIPATAGADFGNVADVSALESRAANRNWDVSQASRLVLPPKGDGRMWSFRSPSETGGRPSSGATVELLGEVPAPGGPSIDTLSTGVRDLQGFLDYGTPLQTTPVTGLGAQPTAPPGDPTKYFFSTHGRVPEADLFVPPGSPPTQWFDQPATEGFGLSGKGLSLDAGSGPPSPLARKNDLDSRSVTFSALSDVDASEFWKKHPGHEAKNRAAAAGYDAARSQSMFEVTKEWEQPYRGFDRKAVVISPEGKPTSASGLDPQAQKSNSPSNFVDINQLVPGGAPGQGRFPAVDEFDSKKSPPADLSEESLLRQRNVVQDLQEEDANLEKLKPGQPGDPLDGIKQAHREKLVAEQQSLAALEERFDQLKADSSSQTQGVVERELQRREATLPLAEEERKKGSEALAKKDYETAFAHLNNAALGFATAPGKTNEREEAVQNLTEAGRRLAEQRVTEGHYASAVQTLRSVLKQNPDDQRTQRLLANIEAPDYFNKAMTPQHRAKLKALFDDEAESNAPITPPAAPVPQPEVSTKENAFSTFSLNVSDVSFKLAGASLEKGTMPEVGSVRSEEFINAFNYRDPEPSGAPLAFASERARYPFAHNRDLLRLSVKTAAAGREPGRPLNLVLLLDNSGSMERADRVRILKESLRVLTAQLQPQDKLSLITFSRNPRLWADGATAEKAREMIDRVGEITPEGGTDLSAAMDLGYRTALKHYQVEQVNRLVLLTDGAANLGEVKPETLKDKVETHRKQGIAFDCFGVGWEGYNDDLLEQLSRNGDGRYGFINTPEAAAKEFAGQLAGALRVAASDVKVQVEFNPRRVLAYRQIGYARHQLKKEQFRDNTVDAAEIGAAESGNALYTIELNPKGEGDIATVRVRFKKPGTADYHEHEWTVPFQAPAQPLEQAGSSLRLAATASAFSEWLAQSPFAAEVTTDKLLGLINGIPAIYGADPRPAKLEWMIRQAKSLSGK